MNKGQKTFRVSLTAACPEAVASAVKSARQRGFRVVRVSTDHSATTVRCDLTLKNRLLALGPLQRITTHSTLTQEILRFFLAPEALAAEPVRLSLDVTKSGLVFFRAWEAPWPIALTESDRVYLEVMKGLGWKRPPAVSMWLSSSHDLRVDHGYTHTTRHQTSFLPAQPDRWVFDTRLPPWNRFNLRPVVRLIQAWEPAHAYDFPLTLVDPELTTNRVECRPGHSVAVGLRMARDSHETAVQTELVGISS